MHEAEYLLICLRVISFFPFLKMAYSPPLLMSVFLKTQFLGTLYI